MSTISTASTIESSERNGDHCCTPKECKESICQHESNHGDLINPLALSSTRPNDGGQLNKSKVKPWTSFINFATLKQVRLDLLSGSFSKPSCAESKSTQVSTETAAEVKRKWRQEQISLLRTINCSINSSWRKRQITVLWCGWLQKRSSGIVGRWQARWFELRQEPNPEDGAGANRAVLQYTGRGSSGSEEAKRLEITDARRDCGHDGAGRACLSVGAAGRGGRVLLGAVSDREAASLLSCIAFVMRPPPVGRVQR
jgi:hypothetical protein